MSLSQRTDSSQLTRRGDTSTRRESNNSSSTSLSDKLKERELRQRNERKQLTLYKHPFRVISLFLNVLIEYLLSLFKQIIASPLIMMIAIPIISIIILHWIPFIPTIDIIDLFYIYIEWILWWLILGILSSIGLGTGMHSGILFLFPFIGQVCMVAATCHSLDFDTFGSNQFHCITKHSQLNSTVTFWGLFFKVFWPCFLWGAGTAIGEIPPYALSLAAKKAGRQDEFAEIQQELENRSPSSVTIFDRMKLWMINFLEKYGFWAVLAFAAWPNMAFDMCGIACGHFEMSFWTFFGATFIGKAIIKINMQSMFFITMFNEKSLNKFIDYMEHFGLEFVSNAATEFFETQRQIILGNVDSSTLNENKPTPIFKILWTLFVSGFILMFIGSTIQVFAQQKQKEIDEKENERWSKAQT